MTEPNKARVTELESTDAQEIGARRFLTKGVVSSKINVVVEKRVNINYDNYVNLFPNMYEEE